MSSAGKVALVEHDIEGGWIAADGQRVRVDAHGPQKARCDCPAPGLCKHILGAALWLREQSAAPAEPAADAPPVGAVDPLADLLALDAAALFGRWRCRGAARRSDRGGRRRMALQGGAVVLVLPALGQSRR